MLKRNGSSSTFSEFLAQKKRHKSKELLIDPLKKEVCSLYISRHLSWDDREVNSSNKKPSHERSKQGCDRQGNTVGKYALQSLYYIRSSANPNHTTNKFRAPDAAFDVDQFTPLIVNSSTKDVNNTSNGYQKASIDGKLIHSPQDSSMRPIHLNHSLQQPLRSYNLGQPTTSTKPVMVQFGFSFHQSDNASGLKKHRISNISHEKREWARKKADQYFFKKTAQGREAARQKQSKEIEYLEKKMFNETALRQTKKSELDKDYSIEKVAGAK